jgi:hypothetical protein
MVHQVLHEHAASLSAATHANRSRRLIKCAKDSGHYQAAQVACEGQDAKEGQAGDSEQGHCWDGPERKTDLSDCYNEQKTAHQRDRQDVQANRRLPGV